MLFTGGVCMAGGSICVAGEGDVWQEACVAGGMHDAWWGHVCKGGHAWQGVYMAGAWVAGQTATAEDGTHHTGMHSCQFS